MGRHSQDTSIPAQRRLYMTATLAWTPEDPKKRRRRKMLPPRTIRPNRSPPWTTRPSTVLVYQLGLADAIDRGILADYRIVVPVISDDELRSSAGQRPNSAHRRSAPGRPADRPAARHGHSQRAPRRRFHSRIVYAQQFSETLPHRRRRRTARASAAYGCMPSTAVSRPKPGLAPAEFESVPPTPRSGLHDTLDGAVLSNVRVLGGVDVHADAVLFADPKRSSSDAVSHWAGRCASLQDPAKLPR